MAKTALILHVDAQLASPYAMSVFVALHEKALAFDVSTVDLAAGKNHEAGFAAISLTRRIPTLVHDGFSLSESSAICEYIDETFPGTALYPAAARDRARARQVQAWLRSDFLPIRAERSTETIFYGKKMPPLSAAAQASAAKLFGAVAPLIDPAAEHLFGQWCIADVDLAVMLKRLIAHGDPVPEPLVSYAARQWMRASVQRWITQTRTPL